MSEDAKLEQVNLRIALLFISLLQPFLPCLATTRVVCCLSLSFVFLRAVFVLPTATVVVV